MLHEKDLFGDVVFTIWKSKKTAWHWVSLYRKNRKYTVTGLQSTYVDVAYLWNFRGKGYRLIAMEWLGLPRKYRRLIPPKAFNDSNKDKEK